MRRIIQRTVTTVKIVSLTLTYAEDGSPAETPAAEPPIDQSADVQQRALPAPIKTQPIEPLSDTSTSSTPTGTDWKRLRST